MLEKSLQPNERLHDNPLGLSLQALATSLVEDGYADQTVRSKLRLLDELGRWFGLTGLTVAHLDERQRRLSNTGSKSAGAIQKRSNSFSITFGSVPLSQIERQCVTDRPWLTS